MPAFLRLVRDRLGPALLTAAGVGLLGAGLLHDAGPISAEPGPADASPSNLAVVPFPSLVVPSLPPVETVAPSAGDPAPSLGPLPSSGKRVATRVVVAELGIDLPVIAQPNPSYPSCNVAMYYQAAGLGQPGQGRSTYLYAHARTGMFGPLYERAILGRGGGAKSLIGLPVDVYTSDDQHFVYTITKVLPRVKADSHFLDGPLAVTSDTLWLQTSTGPNGTYPKLQVVAEPLGVVPATHADAHPKARPINCA